MTNIEKFILSLISIITLILTIVFISYSFSMIKGYNKLQQNRADAAYIDGIKAKENNISVTANPYQGSWKAKYWLEGYMDSNEK